jgi:hypothetical protein
MFVVVIRVKKERESKGRGASQAAKSRGTKEGHGKQKVHGNGKGDVREGKTMLLCRGS